MKIVHDWVQKADQTPHMAIVKVIVHEEIYFRENYINLTPHMIILIASRINQNESSDYNRK